MTSSTIQQRINLHYIVFHGHEESLRDNNKNYDTFYVKLSGVILSYSMIRHKKERNTEFSVLV